MLINGEYQPTLSIPVETCQHFSVHPLSWLWYVGFTIYSTEGHISQSATGPVVLYSEVDIQAGVYYYIPDSQGKSYFGIQGPLNAKCSFNVRSNSAWPWFDGGQDFRVLNYLYSPAWFCTESDWLWWNLFDNWCNKNFKHVKLFLTQRETRCVLYIWIQPITSHCITSMLIMSLHS